LRRGRLSAFTAAEAVGIVTRRGVSGKGSANESKRRAFAVAAVLRDSAAQQRDNSLAPSEPRNVVKTVAGGVGPLPCMLCSHPQAMLARQEISDVFLANQAGDGARRPALDGALPRACCRRSLTVLDPSAHRLIVPT